MRILFGLIWGAAIASAAAAQVPSTAPPPPADPVTFSSAADIQALIAKAKAEIKPGQPALVQPILRLAPYRANLEYRVAGTPANVHVVDAEFVYVISGSGTVVIGGTLKDPKPPANGNIIGTTVEGGVATSYKAGDTFIVPENTPHWFNAMTGPVVMITLHVPRPVTWVK